MLEQDIAALRARLDRLREREYASRAQALKIVREMQTLDRKRETRLLCTLGRAWFALAEQSPGTRTTMQRFLDSYISREADREILQHTAWAVTSPAAMPNVGHNDKDARESD
jgi:hypothetical protein